MVDELTHSHRRTFGLWALLAALAVGLLAGGASMKFTSTTASHRQEAEVDKAPPLPPGVVEIPEPPRRTPASRWRPFR